MARDYHRILLIFVDGVGLAPATAGNPLEVEPSPHLDRLLGGGLTSERAQSGGELALGAIDATLGIPGLPQSATGQTALFTGENGAAALGRHVTGFVGPRLRNVIERRGIFRQLARAGVQGTFANAYTWGTAVSYGASSSQPDSPFAQAGGGFCLLFGPLALFFSQGTLLR